jgi:hypothetical protein
MKTFKTIDPLTIKQHPDVVGSIVRYDKPEQTFYILLQDEYILIAVCDYFTNKRTKVSEWLTYQLEMPKAGLPWIVSTIENKFFKLSHEGGLPKDVFHYAEVVDGEKLMIGRPMYLGTRENPEAGYEISTNSRKEGRTPKSLNFTDSFLFEHGLFDLFKDIAKKIDTDEI